MKKFYLLLSFALIIFSASAVYSQCVTVPTTPNASQIALMWAYFDQNTPTGVEQAEIQDGGNFGGYNFDEPNGRFSWQIPNSFRNLIDSFGTSVIMDLTDGNTNAFPGSLGINQDTFMLFNYAGGFMAGGYTMRSTTIYIVDPAQSLSAPGNMDLTYTLFAAGTTTNSNAAGLYYVANFGNINFNTTKPVFFKNADLQIVGTSAWTNGIVYPTGMNNGIPAKVRFGGMESNGLPTPVASSPAGNSAASYVNGIVSFDGYAVAVTNFVLPTGDGCGAYYAPMTISTSANTVINAEYNYMPPPALGSPAPLIVGTQMFTATAVSTVASYQVDGSSVPNLSGNETTIANNSTNKTTAANATISIPYDANLWGSIIPATLPDQLVIMGYNGTQWVILSTTGGSTGLPTGTLTAANVNLASFTKISVGKASLTTMLPIILLSFTAEKSNNDAIVRWQTSSEVNSDYFDVLESTDGVNFTSLGTVKAAGNSNITLSYNFTSKNVTPGIHYYELKSVDLDGRYTYSRILVLNFTDQAGILLFPNPVHGILYITGLQGSNTINVIDAAGRRILTRINTGTTAEIDAGNFSPGVYYVEIINANGDKIIKSSPVIKR